MCNRMVRHTLYGGVHSPHSSTSVGALMYDGDGVRLVFTTSAGAQQLLHQHYNDSCYHHHHHTNVWVSLGAARSGGRVAYPSVNTGSAGVEVGVRQGRIFLVFSLQMNDLEI